MSSELVPLRSVLAIYRARSLTRAAADLGLTQPALTAHLKSVEAMLGQPLFRRHARGVDPLPVTDELIAAIAPGLDKVTTAFAQLRARSGGLAGTVRIAGPSEFLSARIAPAIAALGAAGLSVRLTLGGRRRIYEALQAGQVDLAITASDPAGTGLSSDVLADERLLPVAALDWLAREGVAGMGDLPRHPVVSYDEDQAMIRAGLAPFGLTLPDAPAAHVAADLRLLRALIVEGAGWGVLPDYLVAGDLAARRLRCLAPLDRAAVNTLYLVATPAARREPRVAFARDQILKDFA
jgi:DNA-binding transcriptional LysR family regulator